MNGQGDTRDIAASKAGLGSGKTLEAAQKVVEHGASIFADTSRLKRDLEAAQEAVEYGTPEPVSGFSSN